MSEEKNEYIESLRKYNESLIKAKKNNRKIAKKLAEEIIENSDLEPKKDKGGPDDR